MDDVTGQSTVENPVEPTTPSVGSDENKLPEATDASKGAEGAEVNPVQEYEKKLENLNRALKQERERYKALMREQAEEQGRRRLENLPGDNVEEVMQHPLVQDLLVKQAEYELKEGVKEVLENYPNLPKALSNAILKNPRGYVNPATTDVQNALLDIQDYLEGIYPEFAKEMPSVAPKNVPVAGTNKVVGASTQNVDIRELLETPVEEWTPEQEKAFEAHKRANR